MFEGDMQQGELEIGQIAGHIKSIKPAAEIVIEMMEEFEKARKDISELNFTSNQVLIYGN